MLPIVPFFFVAQVATTETAIVPKYITRYEEIRPLPGQLDDILVFNSNSPEVLRSDGILLSTFPSSGKAQPSAHLDRALKGRFDFFSHHISRPLGDKRTLYQGVIVRNPVSQPVTIRILQGASYLTSPDAPFIDLPPKVEDPVGKIFSGPGARLVGDILRGVSQPQFPREVVIPAHESRMLFTLPIPPSSARSTLLRLYSDGSIYMANLAMYALPQPSDAKNPAAVTAYREPTLGEWQHLLTTGSLAEPRDLSPHKTNPNNPDRPVYGRVAGISVGSEWIAKISDRSGEDRLTIPERGQAFSYPLSTTDTGTYATQQVQSAPLLVRYPDTALRAHGNYAVHYNLTIPLFNNGRLSRRVAIALDTPYKQDRYSDRHYFVDPPLGPVFFRGPVRVGYTDDQGLAQERYFHLVQRQGQQGEPLVTLVLRGGERREVNVDLLYPPDATPPQSLSIRTVE